MGARIKACSTLLGVLLSLGLSIFANAQTESAKTDEYIKAEMKKRNVPGLTLAVFKDGAIVKESAYGIASIELGVPASVQTVYPIASATKPFTATAIFMMVDEGKLKPDDRLAALLPGLPAEWGNVTVKQLLTHTSGLPDVAIKPGREELIADSWEEALPKLIAMPVAFKPGERWAYNQTNYILLEKIFEKRSGMRLQEYIQQNFFKKLGMNSTSYGDASDVVIGRASSYQSNKESQLKTYSLTFPRYVWSAAGINTTAGDFGRWITALTKGKLLKDATREQMWEAVRLNDGSTFRLDKKTIGYGSGWVVNERTGHKSVGHSGGGTAAFAYFVEDKVTVIILTNGRTNPDALLNGIAEIYIPGLAGPK